MDMPSRTFGTGGRYGFNGKERDKDLHSLTAYDYGFRIYNPAIGRFLSVDPLANEYPWNSTYSFAEGDPVNYIDLDGAEKSKSELQQLDKQNSPRLETIKQNANLLIVSIKGAADASANAISLGLTDALPSWWDISTDNLSYHNDTEEEAEAYLRGRIAGDIAVALPAYSEISGGLGTATAGSGTVVIGAGGLLVAGHGALVLNTASNDIAWCLRKLSNLSIVSTAGTDASNSTDQQAQSAHQKNGEASSANTATQKSNSNINSNRESGTGRQNAELAQLRKDNPSASVQAERYLRDKNGKIVRDPLTGQGRRIDFAVIRNGKVKKLVETTSMTANKLQQTAKEMRIRNAGGTYIRDRRTGKLLDVSKIQTTVNRRP